MFLEGINLGHADQSVDRFQPDGLVPNPSHPQKLDPHEEKNDSET